jgi:hypothetical protein
MDDVCRREFPGLTTAPWGIRTLQLMVRFWLAVNEGPVVADLVLGRRNDGTRRLRCPETALRGPLQAWETALMAIVGDA